MSSTTGTALSSSTTHSPTTNTKPNRLPAPALFVGPPSRNASQLSIARSPTHDSKAGAAAGANTTLKDKDKDKDKEKDREAHHHSHPQPKKASDKTLEAKWREMQSTLNEVELTAQSSTHVFGEAHASALDALRRAQVDLAQAWGRGGGEEKKVQGEQMNRFRGRADTDASEASTALSDESGRSGGRRELEDETALDIKLASERRAANEAYFKTVDGGVRDVVRKLEVVAEAMRAVESESRSLWSSSGSSLVEAEARREGKEGERKNE